MTAFECAEETIAYLVDCTMATVCAMACRKSRPKHEYARQIAIAQYGVNTLISLHMSTKGIRAEELAGGMSVADWAKKWEK